MFLILLLNFIFINCVKNNFIVRDGVIFYSTATYQSGPLFEFKEGVINFNDTVFKSIHFVSLDSFLNNYSRSSHYFDFFKISLNGRVLIEISHGILYLNAPNNCFVEEQKWKIMQVFWKVIQQSNYMRNVHGIIYNEFPGIPANLEFLIHVVHKIALKLDPIVAEDISKVFGLECFYITYGEQFEFPKLFAGIDFSAALLRIQVQDGMIQNLSEHLTYAWPDEKMLTLIKF